MSLIYPDNHILFFNSSQILQINCAKNHTTNDILLEINNYNCNSHSWHGGLNYWFNNCQFNPQNFQTISDSVIAHIEKCKKYIIHYLSSHDSYTAFIDFSNDINNNLHISYITNLAAKLYSVIHTFDNLPNTVITVNLVNNNLTLDEISNFFLKENYNNTGVDYVYPEITTSKTNYNNTEVDYIYPEINKHNVIIWFENNTPLETITPSLSDSSNPINMPILSSELYSEEEAKLFKTIVHTAENILNQTVFDANKQFKHNSESKVFLNDTGYYITLSDDSNILLSSNIQERSITLSYNNPSIPKDTSILSSSYLDQLRYYNLHTDNSSICNIYSVNISEHNNYVYNYEVNDFFLSLCSDEANHYNNTPYTGPERLEGNQNSNDDNYIYAGIVGATLIGSMLLTIPLLGKIYTHINHHDYNAIPQHV